MNPTAKGIGEDWLSVWIGLFVFALALGVAGGTDLLGNQYSGDTSRHSLCSCVEHLAANHCLAE